MGFMLWFYAFYIAMSGTSKQSQQYGKHLYDFKLERIWQSIGTYVEVEHSVYLRFVDDIVMLADSEKTNKMFNNLNPVS